MVMQWIILLVIATVVIAVLFFRAQNRNDREVVLRRESARATDDTEIAEEPFDRNLLVPEWEIVGLRDDDERSDDGIVRDVSKIKTPRVKKKKLRHGAEEMALEMGPIETNLGQSGAVFRGNAILEYDPYFTPDHLVKIGLAREPISGHDMPIHMQVSPVMMAMPKDPYWVFVYWILPENCPEGDWEIRIRNLTQDVEFFQRIDPGARRWYLQLNQPGQAFVFEIGVRRKDGIFRAVLTSNRINMPPDQPSSIVDAEWLTIEELYRLGRGVNPLSSAAFYMEKGGASEQLFPGHLAKPGQDTQSALEQRNSAR